MVALSINQRLIRRARNDVTVAFGTREREPRGVSQVSLLFANLRYGLRSLARRPGFTAIVILTLALGIGVSTGIFSMVRGVVLKPLLYHEPDRLVRIYETRGKNPRFMHGLDRELYPLLYWPMNQFPSNNVWLVARSRGDPASIGRAVQTKVAQIDSELAIREIVTLPEVLAESLLRQRFTTFLIGLFAALALVLAAAGLYGVVSYSVSQRTQETGLRMSLGAGPKEIVALVVGHGLRLTLAGVGLGLVASLGVRKLLASHLFGVSPHDPATMAGVSVLLIAVSTLAAYIPARRALRVHPAAVLRAG